MLHALRADAPHSKRNGAIMAEAARLARYPEIRERWGGSPGRRECEQAKTSSPLSAGAAASAVIPLLDLAQRQIGAETETQGWLPIPVIEFVAARTRHARISAPTKSRPSTRCSTSRRSAATTSRSAAPRPACCAARTTCSPPATQARLKKGHTTDDGLFTLTEVECLGACANAPMVQINDDNYEDLTSDSMTAILDALAAGEQPKTGPQIDRQTSAPEGGPTTLKKMVGTNHDYRGQWS